MPGAHGTNPGDVPIQGDHHVNKRKRDADDGRSDRIPQPPPPQSGMCASMSSGVASLTRRRQWGHYQLSHPIESHQATPSPGR